MISLKRYLDSSSDAAQRELLAALVDAYRSVLTSTAVSTAQAIPSVDPGLGRRLIALGQQLVDVDDREQVVNTDALVTQELQQWGHLAATDIKQKTEHVKELLVVLARTATTLATTDETQARRFDALTTRLERMASLEDLSELRASVVRSARELRLSVQEMSRTARESVASLRAEITTYQTKLEAAEQQASRDVLTGLLNRGRIEAHIEHRIATAQPFSVAILDLNGFKAVNDRLGHAAGDDLLKQFSADLLANARATDQVGRWGGDEFIVVLDCAQKEAETHIARIEQWVTGDYTLARPGGREKVRLSASMGLCQWTPGLTMRDLIARADAAMYDHKRARPR